MAANRILQSLMIVATVVVSQCAAADHAACDQQPGDCPSATDGWRCPFSRICSRCKDKVCVTTASPGQETKSCWEVECDEVCIPAVRFPWDCCRKPRSGECLGILLPRCGKVRRVRKLKPVEYECDKCEYEHRIVDKSPGCGSLPHSNCVPHERETIGGDLSSYVGHSIATIAKDCPESLAGR